VNFYKHYIGDFQRDTGHLSLTERGAYLCLMHHYYATEKPLPNDHTALCRIAGAQDKAERDAVRAVMGFFEPCDSGLMHKRIEAELHKAGEVSNTNREIALAREAARRAAREEHEQSTNRAPSVPRTSDEQSTNQTPDTRSNTPPNPRKRGQVSEFPAGFDAFWQAYPRKQAKTQAAKAFARLRADDTLLARMLSAIAQQAATEQWTKDGGQFIPMPASWLNGGRWEDAPLAAVSGSDIFAGAE
jgi:uncharacterized protein YdaU (DUF1376 family)